MRTVVIVGSSQTRTVARADGGPGFIRRAGIRSVQSKEGQGSALDPSLKTTA